MNLPPTVASRRDPLRTFQFRLKLHPSEPRTIKNQKLPSADYIAGVRSVSGLSWSVGVFEVWSGGNNSHRFANPDRITWEPITLEQGIAIDDTLEQWARDARDLLRTKVGFVKRLMVLDVWNPNHLGFSLENNEPGLVRSYTIENAWVSKYVALPKLDAMTSEAAFQSVEITHEGWYLTDPENPRLQIGDK